jgi:hypothetical protein
LVSPAFAGAMLQEWAFSRSNSSFIGQLPSYAQD